MPYGKTLCTLARKRYLVSKDIMSTVSKSNKCKTCQQKITKPLTNERHVKNSYFCTHVSCLLNFDMDDMKSFDIKYFFLLHEVSTFIYIYIYIYRLQYLD